MKKSHSARRDNVFPILWNTLGTIMLIIVFANLIVTSLGQSESPLLALVDMTLNTIIAVLLFKKKFVGVVLTTFALILGLVGSANHPLSTVLQIPMLLMVLPLWIRRFSQSTK